FAGKGDDTYDGGAGNDTISFINASDKVAVDLSAHAAIGADGNPTLNNIENVIGSQKDDTIIGDAADNVINGGLDDDTLDGGAGSDTVSFIDAAGGVGAVLGGATQTTTTGAEADKISSFENIIGSKFDDQFLGDDGANSLDGNDGDDTLVGDDGKDDLIGGIG